MKGDVEWFRKKILPQPFTFAHYNAKIVKEPVGKQAPRFQKGAL